MDDDHDLQSQASGSPSPPNGRITVTVASSEKNSSLALALPAQKTNGGGREDCWSEGATAVLIEAWGERYVELSRGNLKQTHWKEVAQIVSSREEYGKTPKTDIQCKNRIDTVKKKYKMEKAKISTAGGAPSRWIFFDKLDRLIGPSSAKSGANSSGGGGGSSGKVPVGIPVGVRTAMKKSGSKKKPSSRKRALMDDSDEDEDDDDDSDDDFSADSMDSLPPPPPPKKTMKLEKETGLSPKRDSSSKKWGSSVRELTRAILRFGEAYEAAESAKLQQVVEMEKQRMKFAKDLELQRMQFFMKTQLEISQLKNHGKRSGNHHHHHHNHNHNHHGNNVVNNSESSS